MAAEIQPQPLTRKPILLQRVEGSQEVVNMAVIVPKEEGVISVSEDRYGLLAPRPRGGQTWVWWEWRPRLLVQFRARGLAPGGVRVALGLRVPGTPD